MTNSPRAIWVGLVLVAAMIAACSDSSTVAPLAIAPVPPTPTTPTPVAGCVASQTIAIGQVVAGLAGTSNCIGATATAGEYALVAFNSATGASASFEASADGVIPPTSASTSIASTRPAPLLSLGSSGAPPSYRLSQSFETALRERERLVLTPMIPAARAWARSRANSKVRLDVIPKNVAPGQILNINTSTKSDCDSAEYRAARVVAITARSIVLADTGNPVGGYTDAEYTSLGVTFDTLVDPVDRAAFGDPSDIDGNGRVLMFFTKAVNDLTPPASDFIIGGFFYGRDLFPAQSTPGYQTCTTSNVGEIFYIVVPDSARGGAFRKADASRGVSATLAHEYQHLINASRRLYVNTNATDFETVWLNEGLSHVAEELTYYRASGLKPRQNLNSTLVRTSQRAVDAANTYQLNNFGRYELYLARPSQFSPYTPNDSLETRGATWSFLRYAADRRGPDDGTVWYDLVNSSSSGFTNLRAVFGADIVTQLRDWGISVLMDDVVGSNTVYQQLSWNFRSIFALLTNSSVFPLTTLALGTTSSTVTLVRGANSYLRFGVAAGQTATVKWSSASPAVQFSLVRLK